MCPSDDSTTLITDLKGALASAEHEAQLKPPALLGVGGEHSGKIYDLNKVDTIIGRSNDCSIPLSVEGISRNHCKVVNSGDIIYVEDLGSKNGTFVNNAKIEGPHTLLKGDVIKLGPVSFKYLPKGDPERLTYDKLNLEANTDKLTGCYNKGYFNTALDSAVKNSKVTGDPLSLIVFDLDHFKNLNDSYGHDAGDYVLKELGALLRKSGLREHDIFARYGGEEFVILLPKTNLKAAFDVAERLRKSIFEYPFLYDGKKLPVAASVGVADYRNGVLTGTDLFKRADDAVYKSKHGGRNQVNFYREQ
jgi:diguanylate cyclase (GGDEF)-like protein